MSLYFLVNNLAFAFGMLGAIVFLMAAWLSFDSYRLRPDVFQLARVLGFSLCAIWQVIHALSLGSDVLLYLGFAVYALGLILITASFLKKGELVMQAIIVIPSFTLWNTQLSIFSFIFLALTAYLSFKQYKKEQNRAWLPFAASFALIGLSACIGIFAGDVNHVSLLYILRLAVEVAGYCALGYWIWQYMRLRIHESLIILSVGVTFVLATIVTLVFSTILIGRVTSETAANLTTDVKVLDFAVSSLEQESLAKSALVARESEIVAALDKNDLGSLDQLVEKFLEKYDLGFLTIADAQGNVMVRAHALSKRGDTLAGERAFEEATHKKTLVTIEDSPVEGLSIRAGAPILKGDKVLGVVIAGYPLDNAFVDKMKRVTGLEMFVYKDTISVSGTAFAADGTTRLLGIVLDDASARRAVFESRKTVTDERSMHGEQFQVSYSPLANADGKVVGMLSAAKHEQDIVNIANATNRLTLVTVLLVLLVLLVPIDMLAKRFSEE